jgi:transcriptional regulator with XRE-family HTH domain
MGKPDFVLAEFGRNLRKFREAAALTQEALAEKADMDRTYLSDIERGLRNAGIKNIVRLAKALGIPASRLMDGLGEPTRNSTKT